MNHVRVTIRRLGWPSSRCGEGCFHEFQVHALGPIVSQMFHPRECGIQEVRVSVKDGAWFWCRCLRALTCMMQILEGMLEGPGESLKLGFQEHIHVLCFLEHRRDIMPLVRSNSISQYRVIFI